MTRDTLRAHYLQHVPFEGLGSIAAWLEERGATTTGSHLYESTRLPAVADFDLLIVMGGPMSVLDEADYPWLRGEKELVRAAIDAGKAVLGVCLGAQLIASALGARVYRNREKEIGWFPVHGCEASAAFSFPATFDAFHWHGETFDLPSGATRLARSEACENQAFQVGARAIGLQFHLETTPESARELVQHCRDELVPAPFIQREAAILDTTPERYRRLHAEMARVLAFLSAA